MTRASNDVHLDGPYRPMWAPSSGTNGKNPAVPPWAFPAPELNWRVAYERAGVVRFLAAVEAESSRIKGEIAAANKRSGEARAVAAVRAAAKAQLAARVLVVQRELERLEEDHRRTLWSIEAEATQAVERHLAAARGEAEAIRVAAESRAEPQRRRRRPMTEQRRLGTGVLAFPKSVVVAGSDDVEVLVSAARASIAKLSLQLRAVEYEADDAEQAGRRWDATTDDLDTFAAGELQLSGLETRLASRRREMEHELRDARASADRRIQDAQTASAASVAGALERLREVLFVPAEAQHDRAASLEPDAVLTPAARVPAAPMPPAATRQLPARSLKAKLLHADVLLPLIAVVIVLVVLLAWLA